LAIPANLGTMPANRPPAGHPSAGHPHAGHPSGGHPQEARRGKLLQGLFWGGMALAPLAVLILLFGQSTGTLRVAVTLAVITIVMLAVSIAMRPSVEMLRVDIEHRVLDEVERVRVRAREETTTAARNTHRALTEKIQGLAESVDDLRHQLDEVQASGVLVQHQAPALAGPPGGPAFPQPRRRWGFQREPVQQPRDDQRPDGPRRLRRGDRRQERWGHEGHRARPPRLRS